MSAVIVSPEKSVGALTPMQLLHSAVEKGASIENLQKLMELQERWEKNQARKSFDLAMSDAKAKIKPIVKRREVDFTSQKGRTNYMYEDLALVAEEVDPILAEQGLSYRYRSQQDGKSLSVTCIIAHRDGHSEETTLRADNDDSGNKNGLQAIGSAATYLQRYTLKLALGLAATKDDDGRKFKPGDFITEKQVADLDAKISEVGANRAQFLKFLKVETLGELPSAKYAAALQALKDRAQGAR